MHILKSLAIAFSIYSGIPVPQFQWEEEDMRYMLCFFPWIGAVAGGCLYLWDFMCRALGVGVLCRAAVGAAVPLVITGGFHVDGFMDTMDAFHSYGARKRKLEILKDPHIGSFAVIRLACYGLIYLGAFSEVRDPGIFRALCGGFFLARALSGIGVVSFPAAKKDGMLYEFAGRSHKNVVRGALYLQGAACAWFMAAQSAMAVWIVGAALLAFAWYYRRTKRELGGITGDTAGWFVVMCEVSMAVMAAAADVMGRAVTG